MHYINELRIKLNCTTRELAQFLGTTHSAIVRADKGSFLTTWDIDQRIYFIGQNITQVDTTRPLEVTSKDELDEDQQLKVALAARNSAINLELIKLRESLESMDANFERAKQAKKYFQHMAANSESLSQDRRSWLVMMVENQDKHMKKNDLMAKHSHEVRIAQLELELELNKRKNEEKK